MCVICLSMLDMVIVSCRWHATRSYTSALSIFRCAQQLLCSCTWPDCPHFWGGGNKTTQCVSWWFAVVYRCSTWPVFSCRWHATRSYISAPPKPSSWRTNRKERDRISMRSIVRVAHSPRRSSRCSETPFCPKCDCTKEMRFSSSGSSRKLETNFDWWVPRRSVFLLAHCACRRGKAVYPEVVRRFQACNHIWRSSPSLRVTCLNSKCGCASQCTTSGPKTALFSFSIHAICACFVPLWIESAKNSGCFFSQIRVPLSCDNEGIYSLKCWVLKAFLMHLRYALSAKAVRSDTNSRSCT